MLYIYISTNKSIIFAGRKENDMATMILKTTQTGTVKAQLEDLLISISWSDLANFLYLSSKNPSKILHEIVITR